MHHDPDPLTRRSHRLWHVAVYFVGVVVVCLALKPLAPVLTPIFAAFALAYLLEPMVGRLARRMPRPVAALLVLGSSALILVALVLSLAPLVLSDFEAFLPKIPVFVERTLRWVESTFRVTLPATWNEVVTELVSRLQGFTLSAFGRVFDSLTSAVGGVFTVLAWILGLVFVPVFAFYFLVGWPQIVSGLYDLVPLKNRDEVRAIAGEIDTVIATWVRGQLIVAVTEAVLYSVALSITGVELAVPIGIIAGLLSFIPYVGIGVGLTLSIVMVVLDWHGPGPLLGVGVIFAAVQSLESFVLTPTLVGRKVGLGEAGALFAVLAGAQLLGLTGMVLAVPIAASVAVVLRHMLAVYRKSEFYAGEEDGPKAASG